MKYEFDIAHCQVCLYVPEAEGSFPVIWLPCQKSQGENVFALLQQKCVLACVTGMNWNDDLSPGRRPGFSHPLKILVERRPPFFHCSPIISYLLWKPSYPFPLTLGALQAIQWQAYLLCIAYIIRTFFLLPLPFPAPYGLTAGSNMRCPIPFRCLLRTYTFLLGKKSTVHATPEWPG